MSDLPRLLTTIDIADAFGVPVATLRANLARLRREHAFPSPLPGLGGRYDPQAIAAWLSRQRGEAASFPGALPDIVRPTAEATDRDWQAELQHRLNGMRRKTA